MRWEWHENGERKGGRVEFGVWFGFVGNDGWHGMVWNGIKAEK